MGEHFKAWMVHGIRYCNTARVSISITLCHKVPSYFPLAWGFYHKACAVSRIFSD